jgi:ATP-dependent Clp protease ATP-binding subunit ClpX
MIPEFIGRIPVVAALEQLDEAALIDILTKPKNAITKQYRSLMSMEDVELSFTDDALRAIAKQALTKKSGARGLRSIIEKVMLDVMYEVPSSRDIKEIVITKEVVEDGQPPVRVIQKEALAG